MKKIIMLRITWNENKTYFLYKEIQIFQFYLLIIFFKICSVLNRFIT